MKKIILFLIILYVKPAVSKDFYGCIKQAIKCAESSCGKNTKHKVVEFGLNKGTHSSSVYGLMPITIKDLIRRKSYLKKYRHILKYSGNEFHKEYHKLGIEDIFFRAYYLDVRKAFGEDINLISYAWFFGITGTKRVLYRDNNVNKNYTEISKHWHVKKVRKYYLECIK